MTFESGTGTETAEALRRELADARERIVTLAADLDEFLHLASHDLQEPARQVQAFAQLLALGPTDGPSRAGIEHGIGAAARRLEILVQDLVSLYSQVSGVPTRAPVFLDQLVADAIGSLDPLISFECAQITAGSLPAVLGDHVLLARVMENLLKNALAYRGPDTPVIHIDAVPGRDKGGTVTIAVRDNGIGIPDAQLDHIFRPFVRLDPGVATTGSGIGLAACRKIITRLGGQIWAESELGVGSTFFVTLEAAPDPERRRDLSLASGPESTPPEEIVEVAIPTKARCSPSATIGRRFAPSPIDVIDFEVIARPIRVLLVEDNPTDARLASYNLAQHEPERFDLTHVTTLAAGLEHVTTRHPDIVLLDLHMSDSQGLDTLDSMVESTDVPIVVLTILDEGLTGRQALRRGAKDYIAKHPVSFGRLGRTLGQAVERAALEQEMVLSAITDPLTGLLNRRGLEEAGKRLLAVAQRQGHPVSVIYADVVGLKTINDTHGHAVGDQVVVAVAEAFKTTLRAADAAARVGGDEFVGLIVGSHDIEQVRSRLLSYLASTTVALAAVDVQVSLGTASASAEDLDLDALMGRADAEMYRLRREHSIGKRKDRGSR